MGSLRNTVGLLSNSSFISTTSVIAMLVLEYETEEMVTLEIETEDSMLLPEENRPSRKRSHSPIDGFEGSSRNITGVMMINASIAPGLNYYKVSSFTGRAQSTPKRRRGEVPDYQDLVKAIEESDRRMARPISQLTEALLLIARTHANDPVNN